MRPSPFRGMVNRQSYEPTMISFKPLEFKGQMSIADVSVASRCTLRIATEAERVIEIERQDQGTEAAGKSIRTHPRSRIRVTEE